jgi:hypothetical protein
VADGVGSRDATRHFISTSSPSTSISQFCSFAAFIVAAHQASLPVSDILLIIARMAEKNASPARFRPNNTTAAARLVTTVSLRRSAPPVRQLLRRRDQIHEALYLDPPLGRAGVTEAEAHGSFGWQAPSALRHRRLIRDKSSGPKGSAENVNAATQASCFVLDASSSISPSRGSPPATASI